ncbi:AMP-binding protein, partial [Streptomyces sp. NRRL F-4489]|uniref:AMP-binding protein n=1 Tax=Streptomyces sp. NRRL F-4489 TaxID=1609095 RepID=UPI000A82C988
MPGRAKPAPPLRERAAGKSNNPPPPPPRPEDICTIRHTGGTTGHPKGICTTFEQVRWFQ